MTTKPLIFPIFCIIIIISSWSLTNDEVENRVCITSWIFPPKVSSHRQFTTVLDVASTTASSNLSISLSSQIHYTQTLMFLLYSSCCHVGKENDENEFEKVKRREIQI
ncbi:hypothetical protein LOK49_LG01G00014 [Camellia lanceoleosa]|uniref:Uncharacterized protein n=1 Tax=Camellia lanceoleosa TaxID=1840588 RepID=A0ACC0J5F5_9ERIC|nr:hypothetical protein LOK49_LG01G00014 [Camellia lanceoleosa]